MGHFLALYPYVSAYVVLGLVSLWLGRRACRRNETPADFADLAFLFSAWPIFAFGLYFVAAEDIRETRTKRAARRLLLSVLSRSERTEFETEGKITISNSTFTYVIQTSGLRRVDMFHMESLIGSYCLVFRDPLLPPDDELMMKVALLKTDPDYFRRAANFVGLA